MAKPAYIFSLLFVFSLTFILFFHPTKEFSMDLGRHIKTGEIILQTHSVPKTNLYSYTYPDFPFINHHWLSEVVFYLIYNADGTGGLIVITSLLGALSFLLLAASTIKKHILATLFTTLLYLHMLITRMLVRPEIFSMIFLTLFITILIRNRQQKTKWIFLLPILELVWVNTHIYFPIGVGLVGAFFLETIAPDLLKLLTIPRSKLTHLVDIPNRSIKDISLVLLLCILSTLCNPNFIHGALYPFTVFSNYGVQIIENTSLFFDAQYGFWPAWFTSYILTCLGLLIFLFTFYKKTKLADWITSLVFIVMGVMMIRNMLLFIVVTFIPFATYLGFVLKSIEQRWKNFVTAEVILGSITIIMLLWFGISITGIGIGIWPGSEKAADFFLAHHLKGPIFNNFDIGSYLEYRLYPQEKVFVDGRPEAYPANFFRSTYIPMQISPTIFATQDQKYHFNTIFFAYTDITPWAKRFVMQIGQNPDWKLAYIDGTTVIFVRNVPKNKALFLSQEEVVKGKSALPQDSQSLLAMSTVFQEFNWPDAQMYVLQKALAIDPHNCAILNALNQLYAQNLIQQNIYNSLLQEYCQGR